MIDTSNLIDPLDFILVGALPDEGSMIMGAYPDGKTVKALSKELFEGQIESAVLARRIPELRRAELVVQKKGVGTSGAAIYQRTEQGKRVYETWKNSQPKERSNGSETPHS